LGIKDGLAVGFSRPGIPHPGFQSFFYISDIPGRGKAGLPEGCLGTLTLNQPEGTGKVFAMRAPMLYHFPGV
jgi:hypothetical protein